jgi:hypothetical protein
MAYTFDKINGLIEKNNQTNIFGGGEQGGGQPGAQGAGSSAVSVGSAGGQAVGSAQTGTSGSMAAPSGEQKPKQQSAQAIFSKAKQSNLDTSGFTKGIQEGISGAQTQLENEANSYVTNQSARAKQAPAADQLQKAQYADAEGQKVFAETEQLLRGPQTQADEFRFGGATKFEDIDQLSTQGGLQSYLNKRGPETYNQGQAALDSLLISRDKGYQDRLQQAKSANDDLRKKQLQYEGGEKRSMAQQNITRQEAAARQAALEQLSGMRGSIDQSLAQQAAAYNANLNALRSNQQANADKYSQGIVQSALSQNPALAEYINSQKARLNAKDYYSVGGDVTADQFASEDDANRYNRILALMGQGGKTKVADRNLGPAAKFDEARYQRDLMDLVNKEKARIDATRFTPGGTLGMAGGSIPGMNAVSGVANQAGQVLNQATGGQSAKAAGEAKKAASNLRRRL